MVRTLITITDDPFDEIAATTAAALENGGLDVFSDLDGREMLKQKLDTNAQQYHILGGFNPRLVHEGLNENIN